jgi:hypothetical protein
MNIRTLPERCRNINRTRDDGSGFPAVANARGHASPHMAPFARHIVCRRTQIERRGRLVVVWCRSRLLALPVRAAQGRRA